MKTNERTFNFDLAGFVRHIINCVFFTSSEMPKVEWLAEFNRLTPTGSEKH